MWSDRLTATDALVKIQQGETCVRTLVERTLDAIAQQEPAVQAWEYLNPAMALEQVAQLEQAADPQTQPLRGIAIALKDIIATADMPTGWGTPVHQGTLRGYDAAVVERLRQAGAVLFGKTVTTEYAAARAGKTRNPHNPNHTPGGSSSGSAAAVAAGMVPLALGTQTLGSILRPAAYCGVLGFKPSFGSISRYGIMPVCRDLDHVGVFAQSIADIQLLCSVLAVADSRDPDCCGNPWLRQGVPQHYREIPGNAGVTVGRPVKIAVWQTPFWDRLEPEAQQRFLAVARLPHPLIDWQPVELPSELFQCYEDAQTLMGVGLAVNHGTDADQYPDLLSPRLRQWIEQGRQTTAIAYAHIRQKTVAYSPTLTKIFSEYDGILMPVTTGTAPNNLEDTGSPALCTFATLYGLPAVNIPAGNAANGLPLGVQLVGPTFGDRALLNVAHTLYNEIQLCHQVASPPLMI